MNIYHTEPRFDCEKIAPCGRISLHKCRKYKGRLDECRGCTLVHRKAKTVAGTEAGRKVCPHCGRSLPPTGFITGLSDVGIRNTDVSPPGARCV